MYMTTKMKDLFGFINDLEKIIFGIGFQLLLKRNNNDRALFRVWELVQYLVSILVMIKEQ